ncbi:M24 family metallopeptidase [Sphingomonas edaphi]|uniref:Aminopeptidase P family protein n=1 Tax=Sphingomonas edaphi TaxID=2315689 RepID=A0A418Q195_9SPHN|nr:Xaa-Pro peptidase family protein [Sphingomonas edaphi]RIX31689.1 aminopeptidase P family protein [Sphingomonas edaphi]
MRLHRRQLLAGSGLLAAASMTGLAKAAAQDAGDLRPMKLPPPIGRDERMARLARARTLMAKENIGAIVVEPGASLDYFTGVQWWRSERLTVAVIPVTGDPIIVTPFFEKPSVEESLGIAAEVRTWDEHEEPLKLVAEFLRSRGLGASRIGMEETNRYFIIDRLTQQLPTAKLVSANPVVRGCRMIKTGAEIALMQAASDITLAAFAHSWARLKAGMTPADIDAIIGSATRALGGSYDGGLVLLGEGTAYPHGTHKPQVIERGTNVLFDCGCDVHGYKSDISRSFVWGADPTSEQRVVWQQMRRGQDIAMAAANVGASAGSVDEAVRKAYESWGYGPGYKLPGLSHRTGHGIGMEGHEPINLVRGEQTPLAPGMCFSNEPGLYLPGKFGIRLEDCFHMTASGPKWFTEPPKSLEDPIGRSAA